MVWQVVGQNVRIFYQFCGLLWNFIFKMQSIRQELHQLTQHLQTENHQLLKALQHVTHSQSHIRSEDSFSQSIRQQSPWLREIEESHLKHNKFIEATNASRVSSSTVKQSSRGGQSLAEIKQSRRTEKSRSRKGQKRSPSGSKKRKSVQQQPILTRRKKISEKTVSQVSPGVLLKKKSKIYHFKTNY